MLWEYIKRISKIKISIILHNVNLRFKWVDYLTIIILHINKNVMNIL